MLKVSAVVELGATMVVGFEEVGVPVAVVLASWVVATVMGRGGLPAAAS
jgi:hypothetical protein